VVIGLVKELLLVSHSHNLEVVKVVMLSLRDRCPLYSVS
jgi:hypothetical protein